MRLTCAKLGTVLPLTKPRFLAFVKRTCVQGPGPGPPVFLLARGLQTGKFSQHTPDRGRRAEILKEARPTAFCLLIFFFFIFSPSSKLRFHYTVPWAGRCGEAHFKDECTWLVCLATVVFLPAALHSAPRESLEVLPTRSLAVADGCKYFPTLRPAHGAPAVASCRFDLLQKAAQACIIVLRRRHCTQAGSVRTNCCFLHASAWLDPSGQWLIAL